MGRERVVNGGRGVHDALWQVQDIPGAHRQLGARQLGVLERSLDPGAAKRVALLELEHLGRVTLRHAVGGVRTVSGGQAHLPALVTLELHHKDVVWVGVRCERGGVGGREVGVDPDRKAEQRRQVLVKLAEPRVGSVRLHRAQHDRNLVRGRHGCRASHLGPGSLEVILELGLAVAGDIGGVDLPADRESLLRRNEHRPEVQPRECAKRRGSPLDGGDLVVVAAAPKDIAEETFPVRRRDERQRVVPGGERIARHRHQVLRQGLDGDHRSSRRRRCRRGRSHMEIDVLEVQRERTGLDGDDRHREPLFGHKFALKHSQLDTERLRYRRHRDRIGEPEVPLYTLCAAVRHPAALGRFDDLEQAALGRGGRGQRGLDAACVLPLPCFPVVPAGDAGLMVILAHRPLKRHDVVAVVGAADVEPTGRGVAGRPVGVRPRHAELDDVALGNGAGLPGSVVCSVEPAFQHRPGCRHGGSHACPGHLALNRRTDRARDADAVSVD